MSNFSGMETSTGQRLTCHEQDRINTQFPMEFEHLFGFMKEYSSLCSGGGSFRSFDRLGTQKDLGLGQE